MGAHLLVSRQNPPAPTPPAHQAHPAPDLRSHQLAWGWAAVAFLLASCGWMPQRPAEGGHLEAKWSGPDGGKISAPASAEWCPAKRILEIRAVQGDTGIAFALYPGDTLIAGRYRVADPLKAESLAPAAGIALRWFTQNAVKGFQGDTGTVFLDRSPSGELGGSVAAGARSVIDTQRVSIRGTFQGLTVHPSPGCVPPGKGRRRDAQPSDTVVH